jgi:hypothetical protein
VTVRAAMAALLAASSALAEPPADDFVRPVGWVDAGFAFNANRPPDRRNFAFDAGSTAARANEVNLNQAVVGVSARRGRLGLELAFGTGTGLEQLHSGEPTGHAAGQGLWRYLWRASLLYEAPLGRGLTVEAGVFRGHIGIESFETYPNWNYTRSWMGELTPYYQAGLRVAYPFTDELWAEVHLLNGWQTIIRDAAWPALGTQLGWKRGRLEARLNTYAGQEATATGTARRWFGDVVLIARATDALSLGLAADAGRQVEAGAASHWRGAAIYGRWQARPTLAFATRLERYHDVDGLMTGLAHALDAATLTTELAIAARMTLKLELRGDRSTSPVFTARGGTTRTQLLGLLAATVWL